MLCAVVRILCICVHLMWWINSWYKQQVAGTSIYDIYSLYFRNASKLAKMHASRLLPPHRRCFSSCCWLFHFTVIVADACHVHQSFDLEPDLMNFDHQTVGLCQWVVRERCDFLPLAGSSHESIHNRTLLFRSLHIFLVSAVSRQTICQTFRWNFQQQSTKTVRLSSKMVNLSLAKVQDISPLIDRLLMTSLCWSQVQRPNHSATEPHDVEWFQKNMFCWAS